eukprot:GHVL01015571.1.p1 GENE.GHVL01015571.1~~GHVL01015571.1.p1  ORF type:complete len:366 (-),score=56.65 GHVL01015571.1:59-1156(-)
MINRTMLEDSLNFIPPCSGRSFSSPHCEIFEVTPSLVRSDSRFSLASKVPSLTSKSGKTYNEARKQRAAYKIKTVENREDEGRRQRLPQIVGKDNARSASVGASPRNADPAKAEYMKDRLKRAMTSPEVTNVVHVYSRGLTKLFDSFASESNQMKLRDFMKLVSGCGLPGKGTYVKVLFSKCGAPIMTPEDLHTALAHLSVYHLDVDPMKMTDSLVSCALIKLFDHMHLNDPGKALTQWLHKMHTINETLPRYIGVGFEDLCNVKIKCKTKGKLSKPLSDDIAELEKLAFRSSPQRRDDPANKNTRRRSLKLPAKGAPIRASHSMSFELPAISSDKRPMSKKSLLSKKALKALSTVSDELSEDDR